MDNELRECKTHGITDFGIKYVQRGPERKITRQVFCRKCQHTNCLNSKAKRKLMALEYLNQVVCQACSFDNQYVLEFHHKDPTLKEHKISTLLNAGKAKDTILYKELDKCVVLCSNCHKIEHYNLTRGLPSVY